MVEEGKAVTIEYTLKLDDGSTVESNVGSDPLTYVQGEARLLPALQAALSGLEENESKAVRLTPEQGYGPVNPDAFQDVGVDAIPADARSVGTQLVGQDASGNQRRMRVHAVSEDKVTLDLNHPLAGEHLNFEIKVLAVESAPAAQ